jgi:NitT/TauT family transport system substrate-binding protein
LPLFHAEERGYFAAEELAVEFVTQATGNDVVVQLASGNLDVGFSGPTAGFFNAAERGAAFKVVAPLHADGARSLAPLVISAERMDEFQDTSDLAGSKIGLNGVGSYQDYHAALALAQSDLTLDDVEVVPTLFRDMPAALEQGAIDGAFLAEPLATSAQRQGIVHIIADDFAEGFTATYVLMSEQFIQDHPEQAEAFLRAYLRACRELQGEYLTPEIEAVMEKYLGVEPAVAQAAPLAQFDPDGTLTLDHLTETQQFFLDRGLLDYEQPLDPAMFANTQLVAGAIASLDE